MRAHNSGRVTSFVTDRDGVRWRRILHLTGRKILHLTGYDVSDAVCTTLALDISMSKDTDVCFLYTTRPGAICSYVFPVGKRAGNTRGKSGYCKCA
jgi:hypothetical protein